MTCSNSGRTFNDLVQPVDTRCILVNCFHLELTVLYQCTMVILYFDIDTFYILTLLYLNVALPKTRQSQFDIQFRVYIMLERLGK